MKISVINISSKPYISKPEIPIHCVLALLQFNYFVDFLELHALV